MHFGAWFHDAFLGACDGAVDEGAGREAIVVGKPHHLVLALGASREAGIPKRAIDVAVSCDADGFADASLPIARASRVGFPHDARVERTLELVAQSGAPAGAVGAEFGHGTARARVGARHRVARGRSVVVAAWASETAIAKAESRTVRRRAYEKSPSMGPRLPDCDGMWLRRSLYNASVTP